MMAVDFRDLRFKLERLDVWSIQGQKDQAQALVENMDGESLRALSLMAAKRHAVKNTSPDTKTFELLENVIIGLQSDDCVNLAKQTISIAPDWILRTFLLSSVNRFNTVDQNAMREILNKRTAEISAETGQAVEELSQEDIAIAQQAAAEAAERAAAIERGEIPADGEVVAEPKKVRGRSAKAPRSKPELRVKGEPKVKVTSAERAAARAAENRAKKPLVLTVADPNIKVKTHWLTGKPKV